MPPRSLEGKTYWLIGASEGLGREIAREMHRLGARLILSARSEERLRDLSEELGAAEVLPMDVTDAASVRDAAARAEAADGLIYSVGLYDPMTAQDWDPDKAEAIADANFMGALRVLGRVVPGWAQRGAGHVVLIGSLAAFRGLPGAIGYGSSKAALRHLAEDMYLDLKGTGVDVQLVNPGFIRTQLTEKNDFRMPFIMEPEEAADIVFRHMSGNSFQRAFPRMFSLLFRGSQFLPDWLYFRLFA